MDWPAANYPPAGDTAGPVPGGLDMLPDTRLPDSNGAARQAGVVHELAQARGRTGQDLDEVVVSRLFATGLDLHAALRQLGDHRAAAEIHQAIGELDQAIRDIRDAVFDPGRQRGPHTHEITVTRAADQ